jgi:transposase
MSLDKQENISNGPTENLNLKIKSSKRITRGYRSFVYYQP